jgi:hypothetical protein
MWFIAYLICNIIHDNDKSTKKDEKRKKGIGGREEERGGEEREVGEAGESHRPERTGVVIFVRSAPKTLGLNVAL